MEQETLEMRGGMLRVMSRYRPSRVNDYLDRLDSRQQAFFGLLREKLGKEQREVVTAALAESVRRSVVDRVLACSEEPRDRIAELRKVLRTRNRTLTG